MKRMLLFLALSMASRAMAQSDTLPSVVYSYGEAKVQSSQGRESRQLLKGSTLDLAGLGIHTSTLPPGMTNHPPVAYNDREELIIIKEGNLKTTINGTSKTLGPGGLVLIVAGDSQTFQNASAQPVTYYVLTFRSKNPVNVQRGKEGGGSFIKDWSELTVKPTDKGESRPVFDRATSMFERFDVHATALNPGKASHAPHTHRAEELILMLKGNGEMQIGQQSHKAQAGDVILLNSQVPHAFTNTGKVQCGYYAIQWHNLKTD